jgi:hypothetical protein
VKHSEAKDTGNKNIPAVRITKLHSLLNIFLTIKKTKTMKEYMLIFRNEKKDTDVKPSEEQMNTMMHQWQTWIGGIAEKGKYSGTNRLLPEGKTIRSNKVITDGPYVEAKEVVGGYLIVKANSIDEAMEMAKSCPGLLYGGNVEVRSVMAINDDARSKNFLEAKMEA